MPKIEIKDLAKIKETTLRSIRLRQGGPYRVKVNVHMGTCGIAAGARTIMNAFLSIIESKNIKDVLMTTSGCAGLCSKEPMITVETEGTAPVKYGDLTPEKVDKIFREHILQGSIVKDFVIAVGHERLA